MHLLPKVCFFLCSGLAPRTNSLNFPGDETCDYRCLNRHYIRPDLLGKNRPQLILYKSKTEIVITDPDQMEK
jgi:hypothetical protein